MLHHNKNHHSILYSLQRTAHTHTHTHTNTFWCRRDCSLSKATCYGLDGPGIESRWGRYIPHPSKPTLGLARPCILVKWVPVLLPWCKATGGLVLTSHPLSRAEVKSKVQSTSTPLLDFKGLLKGEICLSKFAS